MSGGLLGYVFGLAVWLGLCACYGWRGRFVLFLGVLAAALTANTLWMTLGLRLHPLEYYALAAQVALVLYGLSAFGAGWFAARIRRALRGKHRA